MQILHNYLPLCTMLCAAHLSFREKMVRIHVVLNMNICVLYKRKRKEWYPIIHIYSLMNSKLKIVKNKLWIFFWHRKCLSRLGVCNFSWWNDIWESLEKNKASKILFLKFLWEPTFVFFLEIFECYLAMKFCKLIAHSSIFGAKRIQIFLILFSNLFLNLLFTMGVDEHGHHNAVLRWYHLAVFTCLMPFPIHITKWSNLWVSAGAHAIA